MFNPNEIRLNLEESVLCYGYFNVIHPGHMRYLEEAKKLGKHVIVAIEANSNSKDYQNYNFSGEERLKSVSNLQLVDQAFLIDIGELSQVIEIIKPVKILFGKEYENEKRSMIASVVKKAKKIGVEVIFHAGEVHYAHDELQHIDFADYRNSRLLKLREVCKRHNIKKTNLLSALDRLEKISLLVIGDAILDQYVSCDALGMSAEAPIVVVRELNSKNFLGGGGIVAAHLRALGVSSHFVSSVGSDQNAEILSEQLNSYGVTHDLIRDISRPTTLKVRYLVDKQKIFRLSRLRDHELSKSIENKVMMKISNMLPKINGILVSDFSYGVVTQSILDGLKKAARDFRVPIYGDAQSSSQLGDILRLRDFDIIFPTEKEARLALNDRGSGLETIAKKLISATKIKNLVLKMGSEGFVLYRVESDGFISREHIPALSVNPIDVAGAGDSLMAAISGCYSAGENLVTASIVGACVAAQATETMGNIPVSFDKVRQLIESIVD
jgi:rfaE bifunctional protein kinase chain/domain